MAVEQVDRIVRVTWEYSLTIGGTEQDTSQHSVCFRAGEIPADPDVLQSCLEQMADKALALQKSNVSKGHWTSAVVASGSRVALENTVGHTIAEARQNASSPFEWAGNGGGPQLPWEVALCVSLYGYTPGTFDALARSKRGRFYLPPPDGGILDDDKSGRMTPTTASGIMGDWQSVLSGLQSGIVWADPAFAPVLGINSRTSRVRDAGHPAFYPVTYCRVDTKLDTQRRRQRQEPANYIVNAYAP